MTVSERSREIMQVIGDPSGTILIALSECLKTLDHEEQYFSVMVDGGEELRIKVLAFEHTGYSIVGGDPAWVAFGRNVKRSWDNYFKLVMHTKGPAEVEVVQMDIPEEDEDRFDWKTIRWTI